MSTREKLTLEVGKTYRTRDGGTAEILRVGLKGTPWSVAGVYTDPEGYQDVQSWTEDGFLYEEDDPSGKDIISEIKPKNVLWLNVYHAGNSQGFSTKEIADENSVGPLSRRACIRVEYEEGQFDNEGSN